ncbi:MAG: sulfatase-like hydrolase/transferase [Thermoleophilaceae bacterium]|nr:sulfatase-like hydrolase/transferase [Thermoleophilaceae bacterium]
MASEAAATPRPGPSLAKAALIHFANLAVLWTFAVAQPLFDLLGDNPEFFAARGSSSFDIVSFSLLLVLLPPLVLLLVELLLGLLGRRMFRVVHLVFLAALVALIAAQALKKAIDTSDPVLIGLSVAIGVALAVLYARAEPVRSFLGVLSPAPIVFLLLFLLGSPVSKLAFPDEAGARTIGGVARAPIVMVLLDELPTNTLLDDRRRLDTVRYPGFAELAKNATWFPNAYTVYDSTERAQPAIMDGDLPTEERIPTSADHPNSIFALFAKTHRMNVSEEATSVCSRDLCKDSRLEEPYGDRISSMTEDLGLVWLHVVSPPDIESDLDTVSENWGNFGGEGSASGGVGSADDRVATDTRSNLNAGRRVRFDEWIQKIQNGRRPGLNFKHTLLPHVPWQFLPSGARYRLAPNDVIAGLSNQSYDSQGQLDVLLQRHYLQTGFADLMLQELWRDLKRKGLWEDAVIVVAADHGVAFQRGRRDRRRLRRENAGELAPIPLFIKAPGQKKGRTDDAYVETIDILPTIFDVLNLDPKVDMDGRSAFSSEVQNRDTLRILERNTFRPIRIPVPVFEREKQVVWDRNLRLFGTGRDGPGRVYRIGPNQELLGRPVGRAAAVPGSSVGFAYEDDYADVDPRGGYVPAHVVGRVQGGGEPGREVAVAVNGRVAAVGTTFTLANGEEGELFSMMVPESAFRAGRNEVALYQVEAGALRKLG